MDTDCPFRFLDFPIEIQQLILWKCLEGWKATVEVHEKGDKTTARVFSSVIYDALMLSLTCKSFHDTIQKIQRNPRLFNGELDLIEVNAQLSYLVGYFTSAERMYQGMKPWPLYRTQIFIKKKSYNHNPKRRRAARVKYHADVRYWLMQHVTSIGLWADEATKHVRWDMFPKLEQITMHWTDASVPVEEATTNLCLCHRTEEDFMDLAQKVFNIGDWRVNTIKPVVDHLTKRGLAVTLSLETRHAHEIGTVPVPDYVDVPDGTVVSRVYYALGYQIQIQGDEWRLDHMVCHDHTPIAFGTPDKFLQLPDCLVPPFAREW